MQYRMRRMRRMLAACFGFPIALALASPTARADLLPDSTSTWLEKRHLVLHADAAASRDWEFWIYCNISGFMPLQRVIPGEPLEVVGKFPELVAVPAARHDDFANLIAEEKSPLPEIFLRDVRWVIPANGFHVKTTVDRRTGAVEGTTHLRVTNLVAAGDAPGRFDLETEDVVLRDRVGAVVNAGFELLLSWRSIPVALIVLIGVLGLRRLKRTRVAAALLGVGLALGIAAPTASADVAPMGIKLVEVRLILRADRFDDYCEHRHVIAAGDTFEAIAKKAYGDAARAKEIAAANPTLEEKHLPIGAKVLLPPKLAPPKDAKETLAWVFWSWTGRLDLQRIYPDETLDSLSVSNGILAIPADRLAEFEKLLDAARPKDPKPGDLWVGELKARVPWLIPANLFVGEPFVKDDSPAAESVTTYRIAELAVGPDPPRRFVVERESVEYRDKQGNVVKAGFDLLLTWRGIPLGLIALVGWMGLRRMRRAHAGVEPS